MKKLLIVFGTRPEAIKLAPIIKELEKHKDKISYRVCITAQHREMLDQVLALFSITPDFDLRIMEENQTPSQVASFVFSRLESVLLEERPDWVMVQGDTTTAAMVSIAAFYNRILVSHIEAGLRTNNKWYPYPEEINRRIITTIADYHFAPTIHAYQNLIQEGVPKDRILVTGNTVIDAFLWIANKPPSKETVNYLNQLGLNHLSNKRIILVTAHRRENFGKPLHNICLALKYLAFQNSEISIVFPVHLNPNVWNLVHNLLDNIPNIILMPPVDYETMVYIMKSSYLILTDSGGIQEEAPSLGIPVLVLRNTTERIEALEAKTAKLVGTDYDSIVKEVTKMLEDSSEYSQMAKRNNPYGDGHAAERIVSKMISLTSI